MVSMKNARLVRLLLALVLALAIGGCGGDDEGGEGMEAGGEVMESGGESGAEGGEEAGMALGLHEMYDAVRLGARLVMETDAAFVGTVENTTNATLQNVRVEVHLSNGIELGPVVIGDLMPGQVENVVVDVMPDEMVPPLYRLDTARRGWPRWRRARPGW